MRSRPGETFICFVNLRRLFLQDGVQISTPESPLKPAFRRSFRRESRRNRKYRSGCQRLPAHLLGRHVAHGAHDGPGRGELPDRRGSRSRRSAGGSLRLLGEAEIQDFYVVIGGNEDVFGLQVAMNDSFVVRGGQTIGDLQSVLGSFALRQRSRSHAVAQRLTFEEFETR